MISILPKGFIREKPEIIPVTKSILTKAYRYAEINRIRGKILNDLREKNHNAIMVTSPHDGAGNTFFVSAFGYNVASFIKVKVLLMDLNMRRPELHFPFDLKRNEGFTEVVNGEKSWREVIKDTDNSKLKIMTAGRLDMNMYMSLDHGFLDSLILGIKKDFDLILIDTSPVLARNRNNVDPVLLSRLCDMTLMVAQDKKTGRYRLKKAASSITNGGGRVDGIIYNQQYSKLFFAQKEKR